MTSMEDNGQIFLLWQNIQNIKFTTIFMFSVQFSDIGKIFSLLFFVYSFVYITLTNFITLNRYLKLQHMCQ